MTNKLSPSLFERKCIRREPKPGQTIGCWEWPTPQSHLYGMVQIDGEDWLAHRAAFTVFKGPVPPGKMVCHTCDNRPCCEPEHLYPGTGKANWQDVVAQGRHPHEGRFPPGTQAKARLRKLTPDNVRRILEDREPAKVVAAALGVGRSCIYNIRNGKRKLRVAIDLPRKAARGYGAAPASRPQIQKSKIKDEADGVYPKSDMPG